MSIIDSFRNFPKTSKPVHLAIGMFDGFHLGHQSVVEAAIQSAKRTNGVSCILTFCPHPSKVLRPESPTLLILPFDIKQQLLQNTAINFIIQQPFTLEFSKKTGHEFINELKGSIPTLSGIYVGSNFRFGHSRISDITTLIEEGKPLGIDVFSMQPISCNNERVSSSLIRQLIQSGNILKANELLGYTYFATGVPIRESSPIALNWDPECKPPYGHYIVHIKSPFDSKNYEQGHYYFSKKYNQPILELPSLLSPRPSLCIEFLSNNASHG